MRVAVKVPTRGRLSRLELVVECKSRVRGVVSRVGIGKRMMGDLQSNLEMMNKKCHQLDACCPLDLIRAESFTSKVMNLLSLPWQVIGESSRYLSDAVNYG